MPSDRRRTSRAIVPDGHELAIGLRRAYLALHRATNACFAEAGMTADQFVVLAVLRDLGSMTQKELVERTGSDSNTISAMLGRLERQGLVIRKPHPADGRARSVSLTRRGHAVQASLLAASENLRERLTGLFAGHQLIAFIDCLNDIVNELEPNRQLILFPSAALPVSSRKDRSP